MAYCGMAAALSVAMMLMGAVFPIAMFIAPAVASFLIATVCVECGRTMALTAYVTAAAPVETASAAAPPSREAMRCSKTSAVGFIRRL